MQRFNPLRPPLDGVPPQDVRFTEFRVEPWPEGDKIRVHIGITPFKQPPNLEAVLNDARGNEITSVNIIDNIDFTLVFTMHIRTPSPDGKYILTGKILYEELGGVDEATTTFTIPASRG